MAASGYNDGCADDDGTVHMQAVELRQLARLAGLPERLEKLSDEVYVDRFGEMHLPVEVAEQLAHAYAAAEPEIVLMYIEDQESEYKAKGYDPGDRFWHNHLREKTPGSHWDSDGFLERLARAELAACDDGHRRLPWRGLAVGSASRLSAPVSS